MDSLECPKCSKKHSAEKVVQLCSCGSPLLVRYNLQALKKSINKNDLINRVHSLWRYREFLPVKEEHNIVSLGEGMTPLIFLDDLGPKIGMKNLTLKDEGIIPTGTFKAQ